MAFPAVSTGAFGYPRDRAAAVASRAVANFLKGDNSLREVRFVFFSQSDLKIFLRHHEFDV